MDGKSRAPQPVTRHGRVTPASLADVRELVPLLRPEDARELADMCPHGAYHGIAMGVLAGSPSVTLRTHTGALVGILSVVPVGSRLGSVAFSGTEEVGKVSPAFLRGSREVLREVSRGYDTLFNRADARNAAHLRWLQWMGFTLIRRIEAHGPNEIPVVEFARITPEE